MQSQPDRDPAIVEFERLVRRDATVAHIQALYRMKKLRGSVRTWLAVREMLRQRRQEKQ